MKLGFVMTNGVTTTSPAYDATAWHKVLPRPMRKAMRIHTPKTARAYTQSHDGVDDYFFQGYKADAYHNTNLCENDYGHDEFNDIDNELEGLTITDTMTEAELFQFCTGYDII